MRKKLIILGTSGFSREIAMLAEQINSRLHCWEILGHVGDRPPEPGISNLRYLGDDDWLLQRKIKIDLAIGIGKPKIKKMVLEKYLAIPDLFSFPNLFHPSVSMDYNKIEFGKGNVAAAGCRFTCNISIGDFNLFNLNSTIGHDVSIGNYNIINPGVNISGGTKVHNCVLFGTGSQILENLTVEDNATIGAGSVVTKPVGKGQVMIGVPARPFERP